MKVESRYGPSTKVQGTGASGLLHNDRCTLEVLSEVSNIFRWFPVMLSITMQTLS